MYNYMLFVCNCVFENECVSNFTGRQKWSQWLIGLDLFTDTKRAA